MSKPRPPTPARAGIIRLGLSAGLALPRPASPQRRPVMACIDALALLPASDVRRALAQICSPSWKAWLAAASPTGSSRPSQNAAATGKSDGPKRMPTAPVTSRRRAASAAGGHSAIDSVASPVVSTSPRRVAGSGAHSHKWSAWTPDGGPMLRSCGECGARELRIGGGKSSGTSRRGAPGSPAPSLSDVVDGTRPSQALGIGADGFGEAARQAVGRVVARPPGVPKRNWCAVGLVNLGCTECGSTLGVLDHPSTQTVVLACAACRSAWPLTQYDEPTSREVLELVDRRNTNRRPTRAGKTASRSAAVRSAAPTPKSSRSAVARRANQPGVSRKRKRSEPQERRREVERPSLNYDEPTPVGPSRIPTGDGPRSRPRGGWTIRW